LKKDRTLLVPAVIDELRIDPLDSNAQTTGGHHRAAAGIFFFFFYLTPVRQSLR
jgi:hypothetical protein